MKHFKWATPGPFLSFSSFQQLSVNSAVDWIRTPALEATALPTEQQPLPFIKWNDHS